MVIDDEHGRRHRPILGGRRRESTGYTLTAERDPGDMIIVVGSRHRSIAALGTRGACAPRARLRARCHRRRAPPRRHHDVRGALSRRRGRRARGRTRAHRRRPRDVAPAPRATVGALALVAGLVWFAPDWVGWQLGSGTVRTLAFATQAVGVAAVAQLAPAGGARWARAPVAAMWTLAFVVAVGRVLVYDPLADPACFSYCASNPLLVVGHRGVARALDWVAVGQGLIAVAAALVATVDVARRTPVARRHRAADPPARAGASVPLVAPFERARHHSGDDPHRGALVVGLRGRRDRGGGSRVGLVWAASRGRRGARRVAAPGAQATGLVGGRAGAGDAGTIAARRVPAQRRRRLGRRGR